VPASIVARPRDRIDNDRRNDEWGLWPVVHHKELGDVRVDGLPFHLSRTDWELTRGAPCLGADNDYVLGTLLGLDDVEIADLRTSGVV
jgi:crotonobetainyl-CoA:carnitine CoA-transferase CaiB-like acyl-CoA transferase